MEAETVKELVFKFITRHIYRYECRKNKKTLVNTK